MTAEWALYYLMIAVHVSGGAYTLFRGRTAHRLVLLVLAGGVALQFASLAALAAAGVAIHDVSVNMDIALNILMCSALLGVALRYNQDNWILLILILQAANLGLDAFIFRGDWGPTRAYFADAANTLNIGELATMALAAAWARRPAPAPTRQWIYTGALA